MVILGLVVFMYQHTSKELAPEEDQGILFAVTMAHSPSRRADA